jgi:rhamnosyl/mannosyltransferase
MRIVHLGKFYPPTPGGMESHVQTLARGQVALGAEVEVICLAAPGDATQEIWDQGVQVWCYRPDWFFAKMAWSCDLQERLRHVSADVIHLHTPNPAMIGMWWRAGGRRPLVITHHSDVVAQRLRRWLFQPWERAAYGAAQKILTTSPLYAAGSKLLRQYPEKLVTLPLGIDLKAYLQASAAHRAQAQTLQARYGSPLWLTCGRMVYYKGLDTALHALRDVEGTLLMIGEGPEQASWQNLAESLGVAERVQWLGRLDDVTDLIPYYLAATAMWLPSNARAEAFGLVQVEAMAAGCPVLNTAIPHSGVAWVCRDEQEGLTVPVDQAHAFAQAAQRLQKEPGLRERLSQGGRKRAQELFGAEGMAAQSLKIYESVLAS